jgi:parallel beta-helix repeat protein
MRVRHVAAAALALVQLVLYPAAARTIHVPKDFATVRKAVNNADEGDTVRIANGIYTERLELKDRLCLIGEDKEKTVIWGKGSRPVIKAAERAVVRDVTIKGGSVGIRSENAFMTIENTIITENAETGVHCLLALPEIRNNIITANAWTGIFCEGVRSLRASIEHNVIAGNGYSGIMLAGRSEVLISHNILFDNKQYGIWVNEDSRRSRIVYNDIYGNRTAFNSHATVDNTNLSVDPGFVLKAPETYDYLHRSGAALRGQGKAGIDIGPLDEAQIKEAQVDPDRDGVAGGKDQCPGVAEDLDGFEDEDGCPEFDNDGDGLYDKTDECPDEAEDADGFEDQDGCPEPDNDRDGVADADDKCPQNPETVNEYMDDDGCPDTKP